MQKINPDIIRLQDIIQAIDDISDCPDVSDKKTLHAALYNIAVIGEAASKLSQECKKLAEDIPWSAIINMRHRIVHDYGNVNVRTVREVVNNDLPELRGKISDILQKIL